MDTSLTFYVLPDLDIKQLLIEIVQEDNPNIFIPHCNVDVNILSISERLNKNKLLPQNSTKQTYKSPKNLQNF